MTRPEEDVGGSVSNQIDIGNSFKVKQTQEAG